MKKILFFSVLSGALLLFATAQGQYKYIYKPHAVSSSNKKTYQLKPESSQPKTATSVNRAYHGVARKAAFSRVPPPPPPVTDPPIINDSINEPINGYDVNHVLLKAYMVVHFGVITSQPAPSNPFNFELDCDPYEDYHNVNHFEISSVNYTSGIQSNTAYNIPLYTNSDNHWTVTYKDFVVMYGNNAQGTTPQMIYNEHAGMRGGSVSVFIGSQMKGTINKLILVLQFDSGTKTIVWNNPTNFDGSVYFTFNQNFNPMH